jgi:hypothetical protein
MFKRGKGHDPLLRGLVETYFSDKLTRAQLQKMRPEIVRISGGSLDIT